MCRLEPALEEWEKLKSASCTAYSSYDEQQQEDQAENDKTKEENQQNEPDAAEEKPDNEADRDERASTAQQRPKHGRSITALGDLWGRLSYRCCQLYICQMTSWLHASQVVLGQILMIAGCCRTWHCNLVCRQQQLGIGLIACSENRGNHLHARLSMLCFLLRLCLCLCCHQMTALAISTCVCPPAAGVVTSTLEVAAGM